MPKFQVEFNPRRTVPPESVVELIRKAEIEIDPEDLLPLLSLVVHDCGEYLHRAGGTDGRFDSEWDENPARMQREAGRALAAVEAMVELNVLVNAQDAERTEARKRRMGK
jgi:hypothetical protein